MTIFFLSFFKPRPFCLCSDPPRDPIPTSGLGHLLAGIPQQVFVARRISKMMSSLLFRRVLFSLCLCTCFISFCNLKEASQGRSNTMNCGISRSLMLLIFNSFPTLRKPLLSLFQNMHCSLPLTEILLFESPVQMHFLQKHFLFLPAS